MDPTQQGNNSKQDLLVGWKDIAVYLKCSVRKAQRLEQRGLPVNRIPGTKSVWALKTGIDRWMTPPTDATPIYTSPCTQAFQTTRTLLSREAVTDSPDEEVSNGMSPLWFKQSGGFRRFILIYGPLCAVGILLGSTTASMFAAAYGLSIVLLLLTTAFVALIYRRLPDTRYGRALLGLFIIAGMSYSASATTLPHVIESVVNMTVLRPALAYPFLAGLRFIPIPVVILIFLVVLHNGRGFADNLRLRLTYICLGAIFLSASMVFGPGLSGTFRVWQAGLPLRWTLLAGEVFISLANVVLFAIGYRFFCGRARDYTRFLSWCGIGYLFIALTAAITSRHWYEIDRLYLDIRQPAAYRVHSSSAPTELENWLRTHKGESGADLTRLSRDTNFLHALQSQEFYKWKFDEAVQMPRKAVIFGFKTEPGNQWQSPSFLLIRFPAELADALHFDQVDRATSLEALR